MSDTTNAGRADGRGLDELRTASFERDFTVFAPGSVLVSMGRTRVLCTASVEERVPPWMRGSGKGWVTAEYSLLPGSTGERVTREAAKGKQSGRTQEIQRLIGRSLRAGIDLEALGSRTLWVDCDVLQADGGTRTAAITGAGVAIAMACDSLVKAGKLAKTPVSRRIAAVSVGVVGGQVLLDLDYLEDKDAEVDLNLVMTGDLEFIELQASGEESVFGDRHLAEMLDFGRRGITRLVAKQEELLASLL